MKKPNRVKCLGCQKMVAVDQTSGLVIVHEIVETQISADQRSAVCISIQCWGSGATVGDWKNI